MTRRTQTEPPKPQVPEIDEMLAFNSRAIDAFMGASNSAQQGWQAINGQLMDVMKRQFDENVAAAQRLAKCQNAAEAYQIQCDICRSAVESYLQDAGKLLTLAARMTAEGWASSVSGKGAAASEKAERVGTG